MDRTTPKDWVWAYHATPEQFIPSIAEEGLKPNRHPHVEDVPVIFVEPDFEGIEPYYDPGMAALRFKTPGFGTTEDGEYVIFGGSESGGVPEEPLVGEAGEDGVIPPERIQILVGKKFQWLVPEETSK